MKHTRLKLFAVHFSIHLSLSALLLRTYFFINPSGTGGSIESQTDLSVGHIRCLKQPIPLVSSALDTAQYLLHTNCSFARFGDGEMRLLSGEDVDFQRSSPDLAQALDSVIHDNSEDIIIGLEDIFSGCQPDNLGGIRYQSNHPEFFHFWQTHLNLSKQYFAGWITAINVHAQQNYCYLVPQVYNTLRKVWEGKDVILLRGDNGQVYQYDVYDTSKSIKTLFAPKTNAWADYSTLKELLMNEDKKKLYILAAGPVSKVLVRDLVNDGRRALDLGHLAKDYDIYMRKIDPGDFFNDL